MRKLALLDIGELGWSLYHCAHIRWLKENTDSIIIVIGFPDRRCLYRNIADDFIDVPKKFYKKFDIDKQDSFKVRHVSWEELESFFSPYIPKGYRIFRPEAYPRRILSDKRIYVPYEYSKLPENGREIMIFPRCRRTIWVRRNVPEEFYSRLIKRLCDEFPELTVRAIGTKRGAYNMRIKKRNYINWVGKSDDLQDLIDRCQSAVAAVGSQSAPPKISLLQGVPTFIIGHQRKRHTKDENWMNTKVGFYKIGNKEYQKFNADDCIRSITAFVKEC